LAISHADRVVTAVDWDGYQLGAHARTAQAAGMLLLNPVGAQRRTNPANLVALNSAGIAWALPVDRSRITVVADADRQFERPFSQVWDLLRRSAANGLRGEIWQPSHPVGNRGVELGATGSRPNGHPWVSLFELGAGNHLVCAMSARDIGREQAYQAWFDSACLRDVDGAALTTRTGILNPDDGSVEIAHFAILSPAAEGWVPLGSMSRGDSRVLGLVYVVDKFLNRWPQVEAGRVLYECTDRLHVQKQCDACAGR